MRALAKGSVLMRTVAGGRAGLLGAAGAAAAVCAGLLGGCASAAGGPGAQGAGLPAAGASQSAAAAPAASASASSTVPALSPGPPQASGSPAAEGGGSGVDGAAECAAGALRIAQQQPGVATGHVGVVLTFTNIGGARCFMQGYPGAAAVDRRGTVVANAARTPSGYIGGLPPGRSAPPRVLLSSGQSAYAVLESVDMPVGGSDTCAAQGASALLVTAPDQREHTALPMVISVCAEFQIHPVVASVAR